jgi:hypothetical protein
LCCRRDHAAGFVDRNQRSEAADLTQHRAAFHSVDPHRGPLDGRCGRLQLSERDGDHANDDDDGGPKRDAPQLLLPRYGRGSLNIHS